MKNDGNEQVGSGSSKANEDKIQEEESLWNTPDDSTTDSSSIGEGFSLEDDDLDCYDGYDAQVYNLSRKSQEFCDNYDIRVDSRCLCNGLACDFGGGKAEKLALAKYRQVIWQGIVTKTQFTNEELRHQGRCPLTPEEIGLLLQALGFNNETHLYLAYYKVYVGEARISALRKLFQLMDDNKGMAPGNPQMDLQDQGVIDSRCSRIMTRNMSDRCTDTTNVREEESKKVIYALKDPSWIEAMHEELLQFKLQEVWTLVDLPNGKRAIGTKWVVSRIKKDEREL
ncbi:hypothetical protein Tco_0311474 [Tanacetum coccineum]